MKTCTRCGVNQPLENFGKKKSHKDGLEYWCKLCHQKYKKSYYNNNLDKAREERLEWRTSNKDKVIAYEKKHLSWRYQNDLIFRIIKNQRNRLREIVTNKPTSFSKSIGCGSDFLKQHLESKFQPGMTWDNYGEWEVDHIRPLSSFENLEDKFQFEQAFNYTNLQPLWKKENILKSNKWENKNENS